MAVILIIAGGIVGFASALASFVLLDASVLMALAIWSGTGVFAGGLGLAAALAPRRADATQRAAQSAV